MYVPNPSNVEGSSSWYIWELGEKRKPEDFISKPNMKIALVKNYLKEITPSRHMAKKRVVQTFVARFHGNLYITDSLLYPGG